MLTTIAASVALPQMLSSGRLERQKFIIRQGRQMVVQVAKLLDSMNAQASAHVRVGPRRE